MFWCFDVLSFEFYSIDVNLIKPQRLMYLCDFWVLNPNYIRRKVVKMLMKKKEIDSKFNERHKIFHPVDRKKLNLLWCEWNVATKKTHTQNVSQFYYSWWFFFLSVRSDVVSNYLGVYLIYIFLVCLSILQQAAFQSATECIPVLF